MIITRTPFRISFAGGGSDLPSYYRVHGGAVLSASINKYMYIMVHPSFNPGEIIAKYRSTEIVSRVEDLRHPIIRQALKDSGIAGVEVASISDVPAGSGLGSSSAFTVGLLHALNAYRGKYESQESLAQRACELEIEKLGDPIGKQDQYGAAVGGLKFIRFLANDAVTVEPIYLDAAAESCLEHNLLMFNIGSPRSASKLLERQDCETREGRNAGVLHDLVNLAFDMREALHAGNVTRVGEVLHEGWMLKRGISPGVTNGEIDDAYRAAREAGAVGGKLLGAGGSGFLLLYAEPDKQDAVRSALSKLAELPFSFDHQGTKIVHVGEKTW